VIEYFFELLYYILPVAFSSHLFYKIIIPALALRREYYAAFNLELTLFERACLRHI
jgi:hypothetical protein